MAIRLIIAGSRHFSDYSYITELLADWVDEYGMPDEVVTGAAAGVDRLGERWALERNIPVVRFPADWRAYGKSAGPRRNAKMAEYATHLAAFPDRESVGTLDMIDKAERHGLVVNTWFV